MSGEPSPGIFVMATRLKARALVITQQKTLNALPKPSSRKAVAVAAPYSPSYRLALVKPAADWGIGQNFVNLA
jgi:hypothetical protein